VRIDWLEWDLLKKSATLLAENPIYFSPQNFFVSFDSFFGNLLKQYSSNQTTNARSFGQGKKFYWFAP